MMENCQPVPVGLGRVSIALIGLGRIWSMVVEESLPQTTYMLAYNFAVFHVRHDLNFVSSQQLTTDQTDKVQSQPFHISAPHGRTNSSVYQECSGAENRL